MPSQNEWDKHWLRVAYMNAMMSKDPSTKTGAVIVSADNRKVAVGYNGFAAGIEETPEKWERPTKYEYVIHAERNALEYCGFDTKGATVYTTITPCHVCIGALVNNGVHRVVYHIEYERLCHRDIWEEHAALIPGGVHQVDDDVCNDLLDKYLPNNQK